MSLVRVNPIVKYLNTSFLITDSIFILNDKIYSNNFSILDTKGKTAIANILFTHNNFSDFKFDIKLKTEEDFLFFNTTASDNQDFYGIIIANGFIHVYGTPYDIMMDVNAKTGRGTQFYLPMYSGGNIYEKSFIRFKDNNASNFEEQEVENPNSELNFKMNLNLEVLDNAEMQIIFDPKIGDIMRGKAKGNLRVEFDLNGDFLMFGDLELTEGDYLFTLENVINKKFFINSGGSIKWEGSPYDAIVDISAVYPIRARLFDLVSHIDSSDVYRKKIPVNLELTLKNNLMTPDITFNIVLPQADENSRNIMKSAINSEQELNRQVFALLILNSFLQPEASFSAPLSHGVGTTSFEFISNQFSNWISQINNDFDIGINYRKGSDVSSDEVEVMVSTQLFNDRIRIEGNVGLGGNQIGGDVSSNQHVMGDFSIENKLTPDGKISLRAFNRSNHVDVITQNTPYTQGIGIFFRKDFNSIRNFFKKKKNN